MHTARINRPVNRRLPRRAALQTGNGLTFAFVANTLPADFLGFFAALRPAPTDAAAEVPAWPAHDVFVDVSYTAVRTVARRKDA